MKLFGFDISRETRASPEDPRVPISASNFLQFFGVNTANLPVVTLESALQLPAFAAAVTFLPATLANLPLHAFQKSKDDTKPLENGVQALLNESPNPEWTSFDWRKYHWHQTFTGGRGLSWIEKDGKKILGIWPMEPAKTSISRINGRKFYHFEGKSSAYPATDVIDTPFLLKPDMVTAYSPLIMASPAVQLGLAMNLYAAGFFAGGGVPPLALTGPMPAGPEAVKRAQNDIKRSIDAAKESSQPVFPIPAGYTLNPVGFDPAKGQMTEARLFQIQEICRIYGLPPVFLQDLSRGTFANVEQQDLQLVKHLIAQWAKAFEDELNLKLFGRGTRYFVEHELDGLMRGDFKTRMEGLAIGVQNALITPDEGRELLNRPPAGGDQLLVQGATVPLASQPTEPPAAPAEPEPNAQARAMAEMSDAVRSMAEAVSRPQAPPVINVDVKPADVRVTAPKIEVQNIMPRRGVVKKTAQFDDQDRLVGMIEEEVEE